MEGHEGSPPRAWQPVDGMSSPESTHSIDGLSGPFFSCNIPGRLSRIDELSFVKSQASPAETVWQLLVHLGYIHPGMDDDLLTAIRATVDEAEHTYMTAYVTYKGTLKETVAERNRVLRHLTRDNESFGLLQAAKGICDHYPDNRGKAIEGITRILICAEQESQQNPIEPSEPYLP